MNRKFLVGSAVLVASFSANAVLEYNWGDLSSGRLGIAGRYLAIAGGVSGDINGEMPFSGIGNSSVQASSNGSNSALQTVGEWLVADPDSTVQKDEFPLGATLTLVNGSAGLSSPHTLASFSLGASSATYGRISTQLQGDIFSSTAIRMPLGSSSSQGPAYYVQLNSSTFGDAITSLTYSSQEINAIEVARFTAGRKPEVYGLALAGLGIVGFAMSRRRHIE